MVVHLLKRVDDQADRVAQPAEDDMVAAEPVLEIDPVLRLGELVLVDDDADVVVGHIALGRLRLIAAFAARDRPVENDLQELARLAIATGYIWRVFEAPEKYQEHLFRLPRII